MQITQEIRDYAKSGMAEKSQEFIEQGAEIYKVEQGSVDPRLAADGWPQTVIARSAATKQSRPAKNIEMLAEPVLGRRDATRSQ